MICLRKMWKWKRNAKWESRKRWKIHCLKKELGKENGLENSNRKVVWSRKENNKTSLEEVLRRKVEKQTWENLKTEVCFKREIMQVREESWLTNLLCTIIILTLEMNYASIWSHWQSVYLGSSSIDGVIFSSLVVSPQRIIGSWMVPKYRI